MSMQGRIGHARGTRTKRALGVQAALDWAFRVEQAQLELPLPKDVSEEGYGFGLQYILLQRAALGCKVDGVDIFDPSTDEIRFDDVKGIAARFIHIDYDEESFFVRHAYFLGANDPCKSLKTALKAEIDEDARRHCIRTRRGRSRARARGESRRR